MTLWAAVWLLCRANLRIWRIVARRRWSLIRGAIRRGLARRGPKLHVPSRQQMPPVRWGGTGAYWDDVARGLGSYGVTSADTVPRYEVMRARQAELQRQMQQSVYEAQTESIRLLRQMQMAEPQRPHWPRKGSSF